MAFDVINKCHGDNLAAANILRMFVNIEPIPLLHGKGDDGMGVTGTNICFDLVGKILSILQSRLDVRMLHVFTKRSAGFFLLLDHLFNNPTY